MKKVQNLVKVLKNEELTKDEMLEVLDLVHGSDLENIVLKLRRE